MKLIRKIELNCIDDIKNHAKTWIGELYDDGTVITRWGRLNADLQSKMFPNAGIDFLNKKEGEKLKKGYEPV